VNVASVPPDVKVPPASGPKPASSVIHLTTACSMTVNAGDISHTARELFSAAITASVHTAAGSGAETWWPTYIGCARRFESASTSRSSRASTSASGRPSAGRGSSKRRASSAGVRGVETGPAPLRVSAR
jgi:hypothetical protein